MPKYHIWTIGCQMNKAESERLGSVFEKKGFRPTSVAGEADIIVVNSCVVRQSAESKAINRLHLFKPLKEANPDVILALTGCLVGPDEAALKKAFPMVDYFFRPGESPQWLENGDWRSPALAESLPVSVYLPIIRGCDNFCSYCIVPYRRGREHSRPLAEIKAEAVEMIARGAREIILLGQNVDSYGKNLPGTPDLADLLTALHDIDGLARLRFLTNHPKDMSDRLIEAVAGLEKVCHQITLPVQAGDDHILQLMRRGYSTAEYLSLIERVRAGIPDITLSTDVIVGFPTETAEQFRHTYELLEQVRFAAVHVAAYSPRAGTIAARDFKDDVPAGEKKGRLEAVEQLQQRIVTDINAARLGETVEVLVEGRKKGKWQGRTASDTPVFFTDAGNHLGRLVNIKITKTGPWSLQGEL